MIVSKIPLPFCFFVCFCFFSCKKNTDTNFAPPEEFFDYSIDGINYHYEAPADSIALHGAGGPENWPEVFHAGVRKAAIGFLTLGIGIGQHDCIGFFGIQLSSPGYSVIQPATVIITEIGSSGQFISGNFSGSVIEWQSPNITHTITCSFKVRRP